MRGASQQSGHKCCQLVLTNTLMVNAYTKIEKKIHLVLFFVWRVFGENEVKMSAPGGSQWYQRFPLSQPGVGI